MGRKTKDTPRTGSTLDQLAEILDEDHLEFEDILLQLQDRCNTTAEHLTDLARQVSQLQSEAAETREIIELLDAKVDRLLLLVTGQHRDQADA